MVHHPTIYNATTAVTSSVASAGGAGESNHHSKDVVDRLPSRDRVTNWDIAGFIISIISHLLDVIFDCNIAYRYYVNGDFGYFFTTMAFILIPALINTVFSIRMYVMDGSRAGGATTTVVATSTMTTRLAKRRICCVVVLIFQLAPVLRYYDALQYAIRSKRAERERDADNQRFYYELMVKEDSDVALLRVLECFLEAAPQQILQLTIIFYRHGDGSLSNSDTFTLFHQILSIASSFVSMAWSMASYQRLLRVSLRNKENISWAATIVQFMWHFLVTVSRILCISVVASIYPVYTVLILLGHWLIMTTWLSCTNRANFCNQSPLFDYMFYAIFGTVYVFTPVTLMDGPTRIKYAFFYVTLFVENTIANVVWIYNADADLQNTIYYKPIVYLNIIPFFLGLIFMLLYYKVFHPTVGYYHAKTLTNNLL